MCIRDSALAVRVAGAVDRAGHDKHEAALARVATAIGKFWICKRASLVAAEAQECFGGIGYIEDSQMPRLFRQSPLNAIWEGCSNIPVSYTHLDVYKRQAYSKRVTPTLTSPIAAPNSKYTTSAAKPGSATAGIANTGACLLYTSRCV